MDETVDGEWCAYGEGVLILESCRCFVRVMLLCPFRFFGPVRFASSLDYFVGEFPGNLLLTDCLEISRVLEINK